MLRNGERLYLRPNDPENLPNIRVTRHSMDYMTAENEPVEHD